jgi:hypothetical protein
MKSVLATLPIWLPGYLNHQWANHSALRHCNVWVVIADHYEPCWRGADEQTARARVAYWRRRWPEIADRHRDSAGRNPRYTFFYPEEEYSPALLDPLAELTRLGVADVDVHLHHDGEHENRFLDRMRGFIETLHTVHGLLRKEHGQVRFGFIHGNWALDNSRPDGRWCGLNNEITLLRDLGCFADFTLPSAPHPMQTHMVNTVYWATDDPDRPKSHDTGVPVTPGAPAGDLLMIPGPLGFNFRGQRRWAPRLEAGELAVYDPPVSGRAASWLQLSPRIGNNIFIKLFTHGAQDDNAAVLLEGGLDVLFEDLIAECQNRSNRLFFVSAWEMRQAVEAIRTRQNLESVIAGPALHTGANLRDC